MDSSYNRGRLGDYYHFLRSTKNFSMYFRAAIAEVPSPEQIIRENVLADSPMNFGGYKSKQIEKSLMSFRADPFSLIKQDEFYSRVGFNNRSGRSSSCPSVTI